MLNGGITVKKGVLYMLVLLLVTVFCVGCSNGEKDLETIILPVISLESTGEQINSAYYEDGFDFKYENLPTLTLEGNEDTLHITLADDFPGNVDIGEDYYKYTDNAGIAERVTYELQKDDDNIVSLYISRRGNVKDEQAIYYIKKDKMTFVFKVILPIDKTD